MIGRNDEVARRRECFHQKTRLRRAGVETMREDDDRLWRTVAGVLCRLPRPYVDIDAAERGCFMRGAGSTYNDMIDRDVEYWLASGVGETALEVRAANALALFPHGYMREPDLEAAALRHRLTA